MVPARWSYSSYRESDNGDSLRTFDDRIIFKNANFAWPPHSPDLKALIFLWGFLKERVYVNKPQNIRELKQNIRTEIANLEPEMLHTVMQNALERAINCQQENGSHLRDIIFHN